MANHALSDGQRLLSVRLPIGVYDALKERATERGYVTMSEMVREMVRREVDRQPSDQMQQQEA